MHLSLTLQTALQNLPGPLRNSLPAAARISSEFFRFFEVAAVILGALGGAVAARRDGRTHFDFMGVLGLGLISGVGGGITRDLLIGDGPPIALAHPVYLGYALLGAALALIPYRMLNRHVMTLMVVVDALSLAFFTVAGSTRAQNAGLGFLPCMLLGITTAVGGGSLRDILSGRTPRVFQEGELYAFVSMMTALLFLSGQRAGIGTDRAASLATVIGFSLRLLAIRYGWRTRAVRHISDPKLKP